MLSSHNILCVYRYYGTTQAKNPSRKKKLYQNSFWFILLHYSSVYVYNGNMNGSAQRPRYLYIYIHKLHKIWIARRIFIYEFHFQRNSRKFRVIVTISFSQRQFVKFHFMLGIYAVIVSFVSSWHFSHLYCSLLLLCAQHCLYRSCIYGIHHIYTPLQNNRNED